MKSLTFIQNMKVVCKRKDVLCNLCNLFLPRTLSMLAYTKKLQTENTKLYNVVIEYQVYFLGVKAASA